MSLTMDEMEWQPLAEDYWVFGKKVRGIVRVQEAEVRFDTSKYLWTWRTLVRRGVSDTRNEAIKQAEESLGIKE